MRELLFVYGTLRDPAVQWEVLGLGGYVENDPDVLRGFRLELVEIDGEKYLAAVHDPFGGIPGCVLVVTPAALARADAYEGASYQRIKVRLQSGRDAWTYRRA